METDQNKEIATLFITDDSGKRGWVAVCGYGHHQGEKNNLLRHLEGVKQQNPAYQDREGNPMFDALSARLIIEHNGREVFSSADDLGAISDEDLLAELLS